MKKIIFIMIFILFHSHADIVVVANPSFPLNTLEEESIKKLFLRQKDFIEDQKVLPFNLSASSELRKKFETKVLKMDQALLKSYWLKLHYEGKRPPKQVTSVESMKKYILNIDGAIGYLPQSDLSPEMKQLFIIKQ